MMSQRLRISQTRKSTFERKDHLLGESSQISLQFVSLPSEISDLVSQGHLVLLQLHDLFILFINSSLQLGVLFF